MKSLKYILIGIAGLLSCACTDDAYMRGPQINDNEARIEGDKVILKASLDIAEFRQAATRAFPETVTLEDLNLYLVEFIDDGSPLRNTLRTVYRPATETAAADNSVVTYTVTLDKTDQPRILHLIAVADDNLEVPYGVESAVIPGLTGGTNADGEGTDAYWRRLKFPAGYCYQNDQKEWVINSDLKDKLITPTVPLVRNFAKVTVGIDENAIYPENTSFTLKGFLIVNVPLKGSFAPYSSENKDFPEFFNEEGNQLSYLAVAQNYRGYAPANTTLGNEVTSQDAPEIPDQALTSFSTTEDDGSTKKWNCLPSQYLYERPFNSISRTYIIIKGVYHNRTTNPKDQASYYKLDLGANDNDGIFRYYGLLRNFNYFIRIKKIMTNGYATAAEAAEGTVYNNIAFDIDTDHLLNMSNGSDIVRVNFTTAVITENNQTLDFQFAYKAGIQSSNNGTYNNELAQVIGLEAGAVIKSVTKTSTGGTGANPANPWDTYKIECNNPVSGITYTQEFTVVNSETGLGRTITLVSHQKWDFISPREYAGIWENYPSTYKDLQYENQLVDPDDLVDSGGRYSGEAGAEVGSQFTIFFDIPDNIPEALFPLVFTIESRQQGLENEPMGTIVVAPGPTLFPEFNGVGENRIQYNKSVTWSEYNAALRIDVRDDNGTAIGKPEDGPVTHRVRCRFRTIETIANNTEINVRIANQNFNTTQVNFKRTQAANGLHGPGLVSNSGN